MAHMEGLLNGLVMMAVGAAGGSIALPPKHQGWLFWGLIAAGYGNVFASVIGASFGVRGLEPVGPFSNLVVLALFTAAIVGVFVAVVLVIIGARRAQAG